MLGSKTISPEAARLIKAVSVLTAICGVLLASPMASQAGQPGADKAQNQLPASVDFPTTHSSGNAVEEFSGLLLGGTGVTAILLFVVWTLYRRHHEAEIRALTGSYIADGVEAAWLKFPELLKTTADVRTSKALETLASFADPGEEEFFRWADRNIKSMRKVLAEIEAMSDASKRPPALADLAAILESFKAKTCKPELRPAWQLAFVIDLLVNRLRERPKELTMSTMRTIAGGLDVLAATCRPGIRPDIIVEPPISILAVDDDPLCLRAITFALQKAGLVPDTAVDGASAVSKCSGKSYDVVFMDIMMPGMDGLEACQSLRAKANNANTPVVFVTARSDFQTRERSTEVGGAELIAKPFLVTELTVKAVTFCMRKRLQLPMTSSTCLAAASVVSDPPGPVAAFTGVSESTRSAAAQPATDNV
jgi:CheY-like chemotaxis protein